MAVGFPHPHALVRPARTRISPSSQFASAVFVDTSSQFVVAKSEPVRNGITAARKKWLSLLPIDKYGFTSLNEPSGQP
jgi:hypothetical protein